MASNVTVNSQSKVEDINSSVISIWRKVTKDMEEFNERKELIGDDLDSLQNYMIIVNNKLYNVKANMESLLSILKTIQSYINI